MRFHFLAAAAMFASASYVAVGCSTPPAPIPEGAWVLTFMHTGASCNVGTHNNEVGMIDATSASKVVTDGVGGATVSCTVKANGSGFDVDGEALLGASNLHIVVKGLTASATQMAPAPGQVAYISSTTQNIFNSSAMSPCNFYFSDPAEKVSAGNVFVSFDCPEVDGPMQACAINNGHIKLANCDNGAPAM